MRGRTLDKSPEVSDPAIDLIREFGLTQVAGGGRGAGCSLEAARHRSPRRRLEPENFAGIISSQFSLKCGIILHATTKV
jgi:hypothetical protein